MTNPSPEEVADRLSEAQRRYMTTEACDPPFLGADIMTFPPPNTHEVLMRLGLVRSIGVITPFGLCVRAILEARK